MFRHPKYYKELRKLGKSHKPQASSTKRLKPQATSIKPQATSLKLEATSDKLPDA